MLKGKEDLDLKMMQRVSPDCDITNAVLVPLVQRYKRRVCIKFSESNSTRSRSKVKGG